MSAAENIEQYLDSLTLAKRSRSSYQSILTAFLKWCKEHSFYTIGTAARYYEAILRQEGRLGEATIRTYSRTVRDFCRWMSDFKKAEIFDLPAACLEDGRIMAPPLKINDPDIRFMCKAAAKKGEAGLRSRAMFLLAVTCGFTPEQISGIMPRDVTVTEDFTWIYLREEGEPSFEVPITASANDAIVDYLDRRGAIGDHLPLLAVTTKKDGRRAMSADDVRKCLQGILKLLGYEYLDVFHGDSERTVAGYMGRMDAYGKRRLAEAATRLYYENLRVDPVES